MKRFILHNQQYELVAYAKDQSTQQLGKIAIYRVPKTQQYFTMPAAELATYLQPKSTIVPPTIDWNSRISLFRERFIGRTDVYANRYFNKKMQKKVYAPAVRFENNRPIKTAYLPIDQTVLLQHLQQNNFAMGLYPLNQSNETKFLVFDIDGHHENQPWQELTKSLLRVCRQYKFQPLVELSQSGQGCHLWLFFEAPLLANQARKLGDELLKATQAIDPRLPFSAFDRLFPAQNQLGKGKLGNLIAAPLEGMSLKKGCTAFVNDQWQVYPNQWQILAKVDLISEDRVHEVIYEIQRRTGFQLYDAKNDQVDNLFSNQFYLNKSLRIIRSNALYLRKKDLTDEEILNLKWLASFHNPQFYQLQAQRMPVNHIPRIITLFQENMDYLILPRGLADELTGVIAKVTWIDQVSQGTKLQISFRGQLYKNQLPAYEALRDKTMGLLAARTGFGKTIIAAKLIAHHSVSTLILVPNKVLAEQWREKLHQFLQIKNKPIIEEYTPTGRRRHKEVIGTYYGQKKNPSGLVDIATIQAISKMADADKFLARYGMVISDEAHHDAAYTFDEVIKQISSKYLYGLSATPYRRDGQEPILTLRFGPIRYQTDIIDPQYALTVKRTVIPRFTNFGMANLETLQNGIVENRLAIQNDTVREQMLIQDIKDCLNKRRHVIVLTSLVDHVDQMYQELPQQHLYRVYGVLSNKQRAEELARVNADNEPYVILATPYVGGEGLDIATLDTMIFAMPYSFRGNLIQYLGRLHRDLAQKKDLKVIDYVDMFVPMFLQMYRKRKQAYKKLGYEIVLDESSHQSGLQMFNGQYQEILAQACSQAHQIIVLTSRVKPFLRQLLLQLSQTNCQIKLCSQEQDNSLPADKIYCVHYEYNLPNCMIIDARQMWLSSDLSFEFNQGLTVRLDQPELIKYFTEMLRKTESGLGDI